MGKATGRSAGAGATGAVVTVTGALELAGGTGPLAPGPAHPARTASPRTAIRRRASVSIIPPRSAVPACPGLAAPEAAQPAAAVPGARGPVVGGGTDGLPKAGRPAPPVSGDCTPAGTADLARFRGVGEQHLEGLAPSAQHHPIRLDLLETGIPDEVPYRVRKDPPPLNIFQVGATSSLGEEHDPIELRLRRRRGRRSGSGRGAGRLRRGLGPRRAEEVALGDGSEGREGGRGRVGGPWRRRLGRHRRRRLRWYRGRARRPGLVEANSEEGRGHEQETVDEQEDAPRHGSASGSCRWRGGRRA